MHLHNWLPMAIYRVLLCLSLSCRHTHTPIHPHTLTSITTKTKLSQINNPKQRETQIKAWALCSPQQQNKSWNVDFDYTITPSLLYILNFSYLLNSRCHWRILRFIFWALWTTQCGPADAYGSVVRAWLPVAAWLWVGSCQAGEARRSAPCHVAVCVPILAEPSSTHRGGQHLSSWEVWLSQVVWPQGCVCLSVWQLHDCSMLFAVWQYEVRRRNKRERVVTF